MKNLILILLIEIIGAGCGGKEYKVLSKSMAPTVPAGSKVRVDRFAYNHSHPARFDIVAFHPPDKPQSTYIFRIIGLPEETLKIENKAILINGKPIDLPEGLKYVSFPSTINEITLDGGKYFVLGDNSKLARDSRYFGAINEGVIIGKVLKIILPDTKAPRKGD